MHIDCVHQERCAVRGGIELYPQAAVSDCRRDTHLFWRPKITTGEVGEALTAAFSATTIEEEVKAPSGPTAAALRYHLGTRAEGVTGIDGQRDVLIDTAATLLCIGRAEPGALIWVIACHAWSI